MHKTISVLAMLVMLPPAGSALAREYFVGGPVKEHDMEIVANYLVGIEMAPMPAGMAHGGDAIHLEADIHATADNPYGYPDGAWVPYLTVNYDLRKVGSDWSATGKLLPMTAKDGPHYAANLAMGGGGEYQLTYRIEPPADGVFWRHVDKETGVPEWWKPVTVTFKFKYPQK
jgi:uncharacterized protein involved in high-affinity Fe2+ transport